MPPDSPVIEAGSGARRERSTWTRIDAIRAEAERLDAVDAPYNNTRPPSDSGGYDCSSTCGDLLQKAGYKIDIVAFNTATAPNYMQPGQDPSGRLTFWNDDVNRVGGNSVHMFATIDGRDFGTSESNPGGGPGWTSHTKAGFQPYHVTGLDEPADPSLVPVGQVHSGVADDLGDQAGNVLDAATGAAADLAKGIITALWNALGDDGARALLYAVLVLGGTGAVIFGTSRALGAAHNQQEAPT